MIDQANAKVAAPTPVGTGPFVFQNWQPNNHFTATRNPNYWRQGLPYLDQITLKPIPDTIQREATLKTGGRRHDRLHRPAHHQALRRPVRLPGRRHAHRCHRRAVDGLRDAQHGGRPHQRPVGPPGTGQGTQPGHHPEDLRRRVRPADQRPVPAGLPLLLRHRLPDLRPGRCEETGGGLQGQARLGPEPHPVDHHRSPPRPGRPDHPADVAAGRASTSPSSRSSRPTSSTTSSPGSSRRRPPTSSAPSTPTSTTSGGARPRPVRSAASPSTSPATRTR